VTGLGRNLVWQISDHAALRFPWRDLAELRRQPDPDRRITSPASFLKHSDDQTMVALVAVLHAMSPQKRELAAYRDWGVVAAPTMFGRDYMSLALDRMAAEGAWGMAPHIIPHGTLHAASGTVSQALRSHGPNISVGNSLGGPVEGFLVAACLLADERLPGLWLVMTGFDPEKFPNIDGDVYCEAIALALTAVSEPGEGRALRIVFEPGASNVPAFTLPSFRAALLGDNPTTLSWRLPGVGRVELAERG
jgi:hypothetical protein